MVDCGLSLKAVEQRLGQLGKSPVDVSALLVTHEHSDHIQGVARFARRWGTPVYMTPGTASSRSAAGITGLSTVNCHREFEIENISVQPFPVPHDAREPCQFAFSGGGRRLGVLTDTGHITSHISDHLTGCDALAIESNHDPERLRRGPYPAAIKSRVASTVGHLNNGHEDLQWVVALHISEQNNSRDEVRAALSGALVNGADTLHLAEQDTPSDWFEIV